MAMDPQTLEDASARRKKLVLSSYMKTDDNRITTTQTEKARMFRELHKKGEPLIVLNVWDTGTAKSLV